MASSSKRILVPQARTAMDKFKFEAAQDVGVTLKDGYNGDLTTRQAGSIGGQMVKKMIFDYQQNTLAGGQAGTLDQDLNAIRQQNQNSRQS